MLHDCQIVPKTMLHVLHIAARTHAGHTCNGGTDAAACPLDSSPNITNITNIEQDRCQLPNAKTKPTGPTQIQTGQMKQQQPTKLPKDANHLCL